MAPSDALPEEAGGVHLIATGRIKFEASSACQLRCPSCPTTTGATERVVGKSWLRLADFVKLVDDNPWIGRIELSNYGEVFLNPDLLEIFRHAYRRGVTLEIHNGANLNHVRDEVLEGLVKYEVLDLTCSIDGATQETYERYRVGGNLERVLANIRRINEFKAALGSHRPTLRWQFIAFGHNEHEIPAARQLAQELGMEFIVKLSWDPDFSPVADKELVRKASGTGAASRDEYREKHGVDYGQQICLDLWKSPQVNWDGKMLGCCRNFWGDFGGNAFRDGLGAALRHEKLQYAVEMLRGRAEPRVDIPCTSCEIYLKRREFKQWVEWPTMVPARDVEAIGANASNSAVAMQRQGRLKEAEKLARVALQLRPGDGQALAILADVARNAGREEATAYFEAKAQAWRKV